MNSRALTSSSLSRLYRAWAEEEMKRAATAERLETHERTIGEIRQAIDAVSAKVVE